MLELSTLLQLSDRSHSGFLGLDEFGFQSGTITAVGTKAEIERRWKELESADEAEEYHSPTTQDQGTYYAHYCTCCMCVYMYVCILR